MMSNLSKIKQYARKIIELADNSSGPCKECPKYIPDLSKLSQSINRGLVRDLWNNYHKSTTWKSWTDIYRHGTLVFKFSHEQMQEIGVALLFLEEEEEPEPPFKYLGGDSARQALRAHVKLCKPIDGPNFLFEYEDRIIKNRQEGGVNLVREDFIDVERWEFLLVDHTEKFINEDIKIIYTLRDKDKHGYGNFEKALQFLKPYTKHIFCDVENELLDYDIEHIVDTIIKRIKQVEDAGLISLAGQWGNSENGERLSKELLEKYQPMKIGMARPYPPEYSFLNWIDYLQDFNKPIIEVEFLADDAVQIERYVRIGFDKGLYGFNNYAGDHLELMGNLAKEYNQ